MNISEVKQRVEEIQSGKAGSKKKHYELCQEVIAYYAKKYSGIEGDILKEVDKLREGGFDG